MATSGVAGLRRRLLAWYRRERRALPWRATRDPYAIWISEAMLQQTRVETVEPYWRRFMARLPDVAALAAAPEDEVLALWSGLGYYRRARSLCAAARALVERHGGRFPRSRDELLALPGIGPYTAGAILSIAFDLPEPAVDGNVARVFCRLFALDAEADSVALRRELWRRARELVPARGGAGDWSQALMELGATVCVPREPRCGACPLSGSCVALAQGRTTSFPRARSRRDPVPVELEVFLARRGRALLLERRPADASQMPGLWQLPTIERPGPDGSSHLFAAVGPATGLLVAGGPIGTVRHAITHHRILATVRTARLARGARVRAPLAWHEPRAIAALGVTGMTRKILALPRA